MLKLSASYSKKVPVEGQEFSSQSFHAALELELSDNLTPEDLQGEIHKTFRLVKASVEAELDGRGRPAGQEPETGGSAWRCSEKQRDLILKLIGEHDLDRNDVDQLATERFGQGLASLNKLEASGLIDELIQTHGRNGGRQNYRRRRAPAARSAA